MSTLKNFSKYVSLNILGMIGLSCYILADTFFVANALGTNGLAALNLAISVYSIIHATGLLLGIGGSTKYAILKSQNQDREANQIFSGITIFGLTIGLLFLLTGIFFSVPMARLLGAGRETLGMTVTYLRVILSFSPCFILNNILLAYIRNDKNPQLSMIAMISGSLANIILDYVFMFPFSMGMFGAAFATGLAPIISIGILATHFFRKKNRFHFLPGRLHLKRTMAALTLGLSSFVTEVSSGIVLIVFNLEILKLTGNIGLAAYGIVANISLVGVSIFSGIAQGVQPLASQAYGGNDNQVLKKLKKYAILLALSCAIFIYLIVNLLSDEIIAAFNSEGNMELLNIAKNGIRIYFAGFIFAGVNIVISSYMSAVAQPNLGFWISIIRGCLTILPFVMILPKFFGMNGVWLSFPFAEMAACIFIIIYGLWKKRYGTLA